MRKWTIALVFIVLSGCGGGVETSSGPEEWIEYPNRVGVSFSVVSEDKRVVSAVESWNSLLGQNVFSQDGDVPVKIIIEPQSLVEIDCNKFDLNGCANCIIENTSRPRCTVIFKDDASFRTVEHEFGHILGLGHSSNSNSIMYSGGNGTEVSDELFSILEDAFNQQL